MMSHLGNWTLMETFNDLGRGAVLGFSGLACVNFIITTWIK
jgi:hypothetical protein